MRNETTTESTPRPPLRLWPAVIIVALQWLLRFVVPLFRPEAATFGLMAGLAGGLLLVIWWLFLSRAPWGERLVALALVVVGAYLASRLVHVSIATGMMGFMYPAMVIPAVSLAFVGWAAVSRRWATGPRWLALVVALAVACGAWTLVRTAGFTGDGDNDFAWRWSETPEDRLLADAGDERGARAAGGVAEVAVVEWPGFRGPGRDAVVHGVRIASDWSATPPVELWRRPIGPGWSSFAVAGGLVYTQEQRGELEAVSCYDARTGEPVWRHEDEARFWESNAGAGPRATPTLADGTVYTFGATGIVNALDAVDGSRLWTRNAGDDTGTEVPGWGFASSPLVVGDLVVIAAEGVLVAYDRATGESRWFGPEGGYGYSSPHLATLGGVEQILLMRGDNAIGVAPADGRLLWEHPIPRGASIVQPALTPEGDLLMSDGEKSGFRRVAVARGPEGWSVSERWASTRFRPYFSDFVVHEGYAYGFDGTILASVDLATGERSWKGGRYGSGQLLLLADQDALLVISEKGDLALVSATPEGYREEARMPAIEGKTWNHPVLVDDLVLVRNGVEMAAFRMPLERG